MSVYFFRLNIQISTLTDGGSSAGSHRDKQAGQVTGRLGLGSADIHDFIDAGKPVCYDNLRHLKTFVVPCLISTNL